uniref:39S ribosomal protein L13, mitochondrial n=1 Tax=Caligus rogercresseyi TaxID=217165 RepID=C1BNN5_CALRO|nr:39S ribosomal protein L13, mitochondrial [Caligus rogercresseyi]
MSAFQRVQQWSTFARSWHVFDAKRQNPFASAKIITNYLEGKHKPIHHSMNDPGDHVIVLNSRHIALMGREWQVRVYFHHTGFPKKRYNGGARWIPAWQIHERDPTLVLWKACYSNLYGDLFRKGKMARLHVFPDEEVPEELLSNASNMIPRIKDVPKKLSEYSEEEIKAFPRLWGFQETYVPNMDGIEGSSFNSLQFKGEEERIKKS